MALVRTGGRHRSPTAGDRRPWLVARSLVDVEATCVLLKLFHRRKLLPVVHLQDKFEFHRCREAIQHDVQEHGIGDLLPQPSKTNSEIGPVREKVDGVPTGLVFYAIQLGVARAPSFLGLNVETLVEGRPSRNPVPHGAVSLTFVGANSELRRSDSREVEQGEGTAVGLLPRCQGGHGRCVRRRPRRPGFPVEDEEQLRREEDDRLAHVGPPVAKILEPLTFSLLFHHPVKTGLGGGIRHSEDQSHALHTQSWYTTTTPRAPEGRRARLAVRSYTGVGSLQVAAP